MGSNLLKEETWESTALSLLLTVMLNSERKTTVSSVSHWHLSFKWAQGPLPELHQGFFTVYMFAKLALSVLPARPEWPVDLSKNRKTWADAPRWVLFNFLKQQVLDGSENPKCPLEKVSERLEKVEKEFRQQSGVLTGETNVFAVEKWFYVGGLFTTAGFSELNNISVHVHVYICVLTQRKNIPPSQDHPTVWKNWNLTIIS